MPRTLLVDTNRAAYPIYQALCALGHEVWVVGGKPTEPLAKMAENYKLLDYSNSAALAAFVEEQQFDHLVPGCTDLSYKVCAEINEGRFPGIDSPEITRTINEKSAFRNLGASIGLPVPQVLSVEEARAADSVIVKPVDSFSGRGIGVLRRATAEQVDAAVEVANGASSSGTSIIEEFVEGQLFSHSSFISKGEVVADFVVQEDCTTNPFAVDTSRMSFDFSSSMQASLRRDVAKMAASLDLPDGLVHAQFIAHGDRYWIIEMTRRCPGDLYSLLIEFSCGYRYAANYLAPFLGEPPMAFEVGEVRERIIRHTVTSKGGEVLWGLQFGGAAEVKLLVPLVTSGDFVDASPNGRAAILFLRASSAPDQDTLYHQLLAGDWYSFA